MYITAELKGNGFGNEFIQLAKLLICRKELGLPVLPAYWRSAYRSVIPSDLYFSNRMQRALRLCADPVRFRTLRFDDAAHQTTGKIPIQEALSVFMQEHGLNGSRRTLIEFSGISPGLEAIESHGVFLFEQLLSAANITPLLNERFQGLDEDKLLVGVHIRRGDFRPPLPLGTAWPNKQWNIQIPL
ncbi:MAG TPA: hypothetical protein VJ904_05450, partial [Tichowtungia sp.]|nr:hypothetical protein [Tichowtungia sp.]